MYYKMDICGLKILLVKSHSKGSIWGQPYITVILQGLKGNSLCKWT